MPNLLINNFYGWMWDDDFALWQGQYNFSDSLDVKTKPEGFTLQREVENITTTGVSLMTCNIDDFYCFGENWDWYDLDGNNFLNLPGGHDILNAIKFMWDIVLFYNQWSTIRLARVPWPSPYSFWSVDINYYKQDASSFPLPNFVWSYTEWPYCPSINDSEDSLYFAIWNTVYYILASLPTVVNVGIVLEEQVVWLSRNWSLYQVYLVTWRKYFWDWFSEEHDWYVDLWMPILYMQTAKNLDNIVARPFWPPWASKLFISQWQNFTYLREGKKVVDGIQERFKFWYGQEYFYWNFNIAYNQDSYFMINDEEWWIESIGKKINWLPQAISLDFSGYSRIGCLWNWFRNVYDKIRFSYDDWSNVWIATISYDTINTKTYQNSGVMYTRKYMPNLGQQWRVIEYIIHCQTPVWTKIKFYHSVDWSNNYELVSDISWIDKKNRKFSLPSSKDFYEIQFKIELEPTNTNVTPIFYTLNMRYEQIKY